MDKIQKFLGKIDISISEAMQKINNNSKGILFIINEDGILMGSLSDGDIRRFLLSDGKLSDRVEGALNHKPRVAKSKELAQKLYHKEYHKDIIVQMYSHIIKNNSVRMNQNAKNIEKIAITDTYTVSSKVKEMFRELLKKPKFVFNKL